MGNFLLTEEVERKDKKGGLRSTVINLTCKRLVTISACLTFFSLIKVVEKSFSKEIRVLNTVQPPCVTTSRN